MIYIRCSSHRSAEKIRTWLDGCYKPFKYAPTMWTDSAATYHYGIIGKTLAEIRVIIAEHRIKGCTIARSQRDVDYSPCC